jgi:hypothetical protein
MREPKSYFIGLRVNQGPFCEMNKIFVSEKLDLIEHAIYK